MGDAKEPKSLGSQDSQQATARFFRRPRLLHSYGVSFLTVARKAYYRVEDLGGPMGALAHKLASWTAPILHPLERQCLSLLSFADDHIIAAENAIESVFPPAAHLFDVVDMMAVLSEALPKKFDDAADQLPALIHRAPLVGWASAKLGVVLNLLASVWEDHGQASEEIREIGVDAVCEEHPAAAAEGDAGAVEEDSGAAKGRSPGSFQGLDGDVGDTHSHQSPKERREVEDACEAIMGKLQNMDADEEDVIIEEEGDGEALKRPGGEACGEESRPPEREREVQPVKDSILELLDDGWARWPTQRR